MELITLKHGDATVWIPGPTHGTRDDGTGKLLLSQAHGSDADIPEGAFLVDEIGGKWRATHAIHEGFHIQGIILEAYDDETE